MRFQSSRPMGFTTKKARTPEGGLTISSAPSGEIEEQQEHEFPPEAPDQQPSTRRSAKPPATGPPADNLDDRERSRISRAQFHEQRRKLVRFSQLKTEFGIGWSRMHVDRQCKAGLFPAKVHFGKNSIGWFEDEILAWINARAAEREVTAA